MTGSRLITTAVAVAALGAMPALALASSSNSNANRSTGVQSTTTATTTPVKPANPHAATPGPHASLPAKAEAYGVYCDKESKKHVAGQKGTPFSQCVTAMAKLATSSTANPAKACASESKKHVAGQKGTPFSQCVSAAAKLKAAKSA